MAISKKKLESVLVWNLEIGFLSIAKKLTCKKWLQMLVHFYFLKKKRQKCCSSKSFSIIRTYE